MELNITKNICRACLIEEGEFHSIFQVETISELSLHISEMLSACATIQVTEGDGLPEQICSQCSEQTVKMYLFKLGCEKSDFILRERLEKGQAKTTEIKLECNNSFINDILINKDFKNNELKCEIEDHKINYDSVSPLLTESKKGIIHCPVFVKKENLDEHICDLHIKKEPEVSFDEKSKKIQQFVEINPVLENKPKPHTSASKQTANQPSISNTVGNKQFSKTYDCDVCGKKFIRSANMLRHKRIHTGVKPYECIVCQKRFMHSTSLKYHIRIHTGEKPYECIICKKKFANSSYLVIHKRIHTGETPYECDVCQMKFTTSIRLNVHKLVHTGEKPYECQVCRKRFTQLGHLTSHKLIHTGEKLNECDVCKKKFLRLSDLKRHNERHKKTRTVKKFV